MLGDVREIPGANASAEKHQLETLLPAPSSCTAIEGCEPGGSSGSPAPPNLLALPSLSSSDAPRCPQPLRQDLPAAWEPRMGSVWTGTGWSLQEEGKHLSPLRWELGAKLELDHIPNGLSWKAQPQVCLYWMYLMPGYTAWTCTNTEHPAARDKSQILSL